MRTKLKSIGEFTDWSHRPGQIFDLESGMAVTPQRSGKFYENKIKVKPICSESI